jgi:hypothetical protein
MALYTEEQINRANSVDVQKLAEHYGYVFEDSGRDAIRAKNGFVGGLYIFKDTGLFYHHASGAKGGAIAFVRWQEDVPFAGAVRILLAGEQPVRTASEVYKEYAKEEKELELPVKAANFKRAYWYLCSERSIAPEIVSAMMREKKVFQDNRGNACFAGYDKSTGQMKYLFKRGTYTNTEKPFMGDATGSDKSYPFVIRGRSDKVFVCESPIDAMSHATLSARYNLDWRKDYRISQGTLHEAGALERFLSEQKGITTIVFAYDNDVDGVLPDRKNPGKFIPHNHGQVAAFANCDKYRARGYKTMVHTPSEKDWNEQLVSEVTGRKQISLQVGKMAEIEDEDFESDFEFDGDMAMELEFG